MNESEIECRQCGNAIPTRRSMLGYATCLDCGEADAVKARLSWCVVQEYGKGGYQFVTAESAKKTLKETNQKGIRE